MRIGRVYDFDRDSAQDVQGVLSEAFGHNGTLPPAPDLDESVADYVSKAALWLEDQNVGLDEATKILRAMLNGF
jgi:hypothetical protein